MNHFLILISVFSLTPLLPLSGCKSGNDSPSVTEQKDLYQCPMHPEVHSDHPGDCPICHMKLVKVTHKKSETNIIGHSSTSLTPDQLKLSGTKEVPVERSDLVSEIRVPGRILSEKHASFQAFEQDLSWIKAGMEFTAETPAAPGEVLTGKITSIDSILDPMTRTVRVDGTILSGVKFKLRTESSLIGKLKVKITNVLSIPEDAVIHTGTQDLVYISDGQGGFAPHAVTLGIKAQGRREVKSGLSVEDKISSGPNFLLDSESRIQSSND